MRGPTPIPIPTSKPLDEVPQRRRAKMFQNALQVPMVWILSNSMLCHTHALVRRELHTRSTRSSSPFSMREAALRFSQHKQQHREQAACSVSTLSCAERSWRRKRVKKSEGGIADMHNERVGLLPVKAPHDANTIWEGAIHCLGSIHNGKVLNYIFWRSPQLIACSMSHPSCGATPVL